MPFEAANKRVTQISSTSDQERKKAGAPTNNDLKEFQVLDPRTDHRTKTSDYDVETQYFHYPSDNIFPRQQLLPI
jgi:hypothetical protein